MTDVMTTISAWVYDPTKSLFGDKNGHAARYKIECKNPQGCDLYTKNNTCILTSGMSSCKFGRKTCVQGPTKKARSFYSWINDQTKENAEWIGKLSQNKAWKRIVKINDHYHLPYSFMTKGLGEGNPLESAWVHEDAITSELLDRICKAQPRAMFSYVIPDYQKREVPKFLTDLRMFYPKLFDLLSEEQKIRARSLSNVGRDADLVTCLPGTYAFANDKWEWDGKKLTGGSMLFQPIKGDITITIVPQSGQPVKITDDAQVGPETMFLD